MTWGSGGRTRIVCFPIPVGVGGDVLLLLLLGLLGLGAAGEHLLEELELRGAERGKKEEEKEEEGEGGGEHFCYWGWEGEGVLVLVGVRGIVWGGEDRFEGIRA